MKKKGFTLIELLAVIIILAVLALILTPMISDIIANAGEAAFKQTVNGIIASANNYIHEYVLKNHNDVVLPVTFTCDGVACRNGEDTLTFKGKTPISGRVVLNEEGILSEYISNGKYCAYGYKWDLVVEKSCGDVDVTNPTINNVVLNGQKINITMSDNESGIYGYCVTKNDNCDYIRTDETYVEHELEGHGTYKIYVKDKKGNISDYQEIEVPIENFKPSIDVLLTGKIVKLTFTSETEVDSYCVNSSNTIDDCEWITATENEVNHTINRAGTYYFFVKDKKNYISDGAEIVASQESFCAYEVNQVAQTFPYTGEIVSWSISTGCPAGNYKLEVWGAEGGSAVRNTDVIVGGKGGYATGNITLTTNDVLYIVVGGMGGSLGTTSYQAGGYNGGGGSGKLDSNNYVGAGGGATTISKASGLISDSNARNKMLLVAGGGAGGFFIWWDNAVYKQYAGGAGGELTVGTTNGIGATGNQAGGGGGWLGGRSNRPATGGTNYQNSVTNGQLISGKTSMPTHDGTSTMIGNSGDGYAKITYLGN